MAGKDELANAVLGGASDYIADMFTQMGKIFFAKEDEKVIIIYTSAWGNIFQD